MSISFQGTLRHACVTTVVLFAAAATATAQTRSLDSARIAPRVAWASRTYAPPHIDGRLDDSAWHDAPVLSDFVQSRPRPGAAANLRTEVRILFDDAALYVGVRAFDPHPDSIIAPYPRRDDEGASDWIFVEIDSRHDHRTAVSLGVNPRGVQVDGLWSDDVNYDPAWNGVWEATSIIDSLGWTVEYRIPFSQLALRARDHAAGADSTITVGLNVYRYTPHRGEVSNWSPRLPTVVGVVSRFSEVRGIVVPRRRADLEVAPYVATRAAHSPTRTGDYDSARLPRGSTLLGGADIKTRITPALDLVLAIHPDFGQVEADPSEVNLTSYETFFPEQRPFFVEGSDLFSFNGSSGIGLRFHSRDISLATESPFYSRRIGRAPRGNVPPASYVLDAPAFTELLGAAKLQGRTTSGISVGLLAASSAEGTANVADSNAGARNVTVEPATQYVVARAKRDFRRGASALGVITTIVNRAEADAGVVNAPQLVHRAVVLGADARHRFANDKYEVTAWAAASDLRGSASAIRAVEASPDHYLLRPDAEHLAQYRNDSTATSLTGHAMQVTLGRVAGEHWLWSVAAREMSPGFEANDVGFQRSSDWAIATSSIKYQQSAPQGPFRRWSVGSDQLGAGWSTGGERRALVANVNVGADLLQSDWGGTAAMNYDGGALSTDALRGGAALLLPPRVTWSGTVHSDSRKRTLFTASASTFSENAPVSRGRTLSANIDSRVVDHVRIELGATVENDDRAWQLVGLTRDSTGTHDILARLHQRTASIIMRTDVSFSSRLTLQLFAQPLVGTATYADYGTVVNARAEDALQRVRALPGLPAGLADPSFGTRDLLGNAVVRWEYRPGSALFVVWSQQRSGLSDGRTWTIGDAARGLARAPMTNVLQVKWSYWWTP
ncbi:MAG: DUF5916 domain-containing protein [bacterium]